MTATDDSPVDVQPVGDIQHPSWCWGDAANCDVAPASHYPSLLLGDHVQMTAHFRSIYGTPLEVGLVAAGDDPEHLRVLLALPFDVRDSIPMNMTEDEAGRLSPTELRRLGEQTQLEPEEARMLARFLVEAADERDRLVAEQRR